MSTNQAVLQAEHLLPHPPETSHDTFQDTPQPNGSMHPYHIEKIQIPDEEYKSEIPKHLQNEEIPGFPSTVVIVGKPGGGKTNLCMNLLLKKIFWRNFFDKIYLLGPTIKMDKLFKSITIPDSQKVNTPEEFIPKLSEWVREQKEAVEKDAKTAPKCLFWFEDITAYRQTVQTDPEFAKNFTTIRHHKSTALACIHKYTALERTARISCMHVCVFPVSRTDIEQIHKEYGTSHLDMDDFHVMCRYAWKADEKNKKPFLYINMYASEEKRFRKCFTDIIDTSHFEGLGKYLKAQRNLKFEKMMGYSRDASGKRKRKEMDSKDPQAWMKGNPILESLDTSLTKAMGDMTKEPSPSALKRQKQEGWENSDGPFSSSSSTEATSFRNSVTGNLFTYLR